MWRKCAAALSVLLMVGALGGAWPGAWAGGRNEAITGDVNGDGFQDRIYLGSVAPASCSVIVQYGTPSGALRPPVAYTYLRPGLTGPETPCPDVGVAVNLVAADRVDDLVVAWFAGPPQTVPYNMLVLARNFMPSFGLVQAIFQPTLMNTADFNGDHRPDVYSVTDQGQGFETYLSLGNGTLAPGPERWCAVGLLEYQLKDFDRDGGMDVLISFIEGCADHAPGVVVVLDDGSYQLLQHDLTFQRRWSAKVAYVNGDAIPDVRTVAGGSGEIEYFIGVGDGTFVASPRAVADRVTIVDNARTNIPVLANDYVTTSATVTIAEPPRYGTARVTSSRTVVYSPAASHPATDRFVYRVTQDGRSSTAAVNISFTD
ncbi:Ig-like domain-containing protein [Micromonospora sp. NPDC049559]|uniref:FG-GAP-like repeat-containing protein n=1 Tax=Micromonospora sp. NPDC049559 TaxID=3155923 RepID=UPI00343B83BE